MRDGNPFAAFFFKMAQRQLLFLVVMGCFTVFFALYGYGLSWITFGIVLLTLVVLALFAGLIWFWKNVFQSLLDRGR